MNETNPTPEVVENKKSSAGKTFFLVALALIVLLVSIAGSLYVGYLLGKDSIKTTEDILTITPTEEITVTPTNSKVSTSWKYITAELPEDWSLIEYADGVIPSSINDSELEYSGFGGLDIINEDGENVFSIELIYGGIGGSSECYELAKFKDTDPDYLKDIKETNSNFFDNEDVLEVIDYTDLTTGGYYEYSLFDVVQIRFVKNKMYISNNLNGLYTGFNPACDQLKDVVELQSASSPNIMWEVTEGDSRYQGYTYKITNNATLSDITGLDQVLSTLKAK